MSLSGSPTNETEKIEKLEKLVRNLQDEKRSLEKRLERALETIRRHTANALVPTGTGDAK